MSRKELYMSVAAIIDRALCAASDWADRFQDAHPTAAVLAFTVLTVLAYGVVGALE